MTVLGALPILAVLLLFTGSAEAWIRLPATTLATLPPEAHNPEGTTAGCSAGSRCLAAAISSSAWRDNL